MSIEEVQRLLADYGSLPVFEGLLSAERRGWERCREAAARIVWDGMMGDAPFKQTYDAIRALEPPDNK